jgi:ATP-dependent DNA helicase RecQ
MPSLCGKCGGDLERVDGEWQCEVCGQGQDDPFVWISTGWKATSYHHRSDCSSLRSGQQYIQDRGGEAAPLLRTTRSEARSRGLGGCLTCRPDGEPGPSQAGPPRSDVAPPQYRQLGVEVSRGAEVMEVGQRAQQLLRDLAGPEAGFREGQLEAISLLLGGQRALVVQRTGWGKSAVYFIAAKLLRERGGGPTLVLSPLIVLMRNQIAAAERLGLDAVTINSSLRGDDRADAIERGASADVLFVTPETLHADWFRQQVLSQLEKAPSAVVVDEVHCISEWGHSFRPKYRRIKDFLDELPTSVAVMGTTATANARTIDDIVEQLGDSLEVIRGPLARQSLELHVMPVWSQPKRLAWLADFIPRQSGAGIVYTLTVHDAERVARWLVERGIDAAPYTGPMDDEDRRAVEQRLVTNRVEAVVATSALGMGYDKPDLTWVVHYQTAAGPIAYYQQVGRAGRGVDRAVGVLLRGPEDEDVHRWFIETAYPGEPLAKHLLSVIDRADERGLTASQILAEVNIRGGRLQAALVILEDDGVITRDGNRYFRTAKRYEYPHERVEAVATHRRRELDELIAYTTGDTCHMQTLQIALDDPSAQPCGRCGPCTGIGPTAEVDPAVVADATEFLWNQASVLDPRQRWASGVDLGMGSVIPTDRRAEPGRALGRYQDGGYGDEALDARAAGLPTERLLEGMLRLYGRWAPEPAPRWVTWVPSNQYGQFLESLARKLAAQLGLPVVETLAKPHDATRQQSMQNSQQASRNAWEILSVVGDVPQQPVLLLDDVVNTRWTITTAAYKLRDAGAGPVHPLVLCQLPTGDS